LVDNRPIKIEIIVSADKAAAIAPTPKTLTERISQPKGQPKAQPKSAANDKKKGAVAKASGSGAGSGAGAGPGGRKRRARNSRPAKKTAEELDSEMADYFEAANNENTGATGGAASGDAAMEDEIS
jgi:THO complex subunit 4